MYRLFSSIFIGILSSRVPQAFGDGYYLLRRRQRPIDLPATALSYMTSQAGASITLKLDRPASCSLVRLELQMSYPVVGILGRPNALHLEFLSRDALVTQSDLVALETNKPFTTFVSLLDAPEFYKVFGATPSPSEAVGYAAN